MEGTFKPSNSAGFVNSGALNFFLLKVSFINEAGLPITPSISLISASVITIAEISPPPTI